MLAMIYYLVPTNSSALLNAKIPLCKERLSMNKVVLN
jgi:hypothetical protein